MMNRNKRKSNSKRGMMKIRIRAEETENEKHTEGKRRKNNDGLKLAELKVK